MNDLDTVDSGINALVAFLGAPRGGYREANYLWNRSAYSSPYCPEALVSFFKPERLIVMVTETARQAHLRDLTTRTHQLNCEVVPATIPEIGDLQGEDILWEMFNACVRHIEEKERIIFDVTYGFRFIPMLMLLAGEYLSVTKAVDTAGIYYGAFEATNEQGHTPIIDLSSFSNLMTWTHAASHFVQTGNARQLVKQVEQTEDRTLKGLRWDIYWVSRSLRLGLAPQVGKQVAGLMDQIDQLPKEVRPASSPIQTLLQTIQEKYRPLALEPDPSAEAPGDLAGRSVFDYLRQQSALVGWYVDNDLGLQAALLAREWLVSLVIATEKSAPADLVTSETLLRWKARDKTARALNESVKKGRREQSLDGVAQVEQILALWERCTFLRNNLAHMGIGPKTAQIWRIEDTLQAVRRQIAELAGSLPFA